MRLDKRPVLPKSTAESDRDHLFVSYAWEDGALAEWLVRKLTAEGYSVWCDRFKILGGEHWPKDIDHAIKQRTFRMLGLISEYSLEKPNPSKERQMALTLSKARGEDFLIPLNVDGRAPEELGWEISDISYIPFQSWAAGLAQLLEKLRSIDTPRPLGDRGRDIAIETFLPPHVLRPEKETLYSNCLIVSLIPENIGYYSLSRKLAQFESHALERQWPFYPLGDKHVLAFTKPEENLLNAIAPQCVANLIDGTPWRHAPSVHGVNSKHVVSSLIKKSLLVKCVQRGLVPTADGRVAHFPAGLLPKDVISYRNYKGKAARVSVLGERKLGKGRFRYQLGISFWVRSDMLDQMVIETKLQLRITDPSGDALDGHAANARRKKVTKSWWNHEWLSRQLAIVEFLRQGDSEIIIGNRPGETIHLAGHLLEGEVTPSIDDEALEPLAAKVKALHQALSEGDEDEHSARFIATADVT